MGRFVRQTSNRANVELSLRLWSVQDGGRLREDVRLREECWTALGCYVHKAASESAIRDAWGRAALFPPIAHRASQQLDFGESLFFQQFREDFGNLKHSSIVQSSHILPELGQPGGPQHPIYAIHNLI